MDIKINRKNQEPIYMQIKKSIANLIKREDLYVGFKMPSERKMAEELCVHRNTIVKAYSELVAEGYLSVSREKPRGYFVRDIVSRGTFVKRFFPLEQMIKYNFNEEEKLFLDIFLNSANGKYISLGGIVMPWDIKIMKKLYTMAIKDIDKKDAYNGNWIDTDETIRLKKNICEILTKENMYVNTKNIQLVTETNQALNCIASMYLKEGDCILVEEPMVPDNVSIFRNKNINIVTVTMEEDGMSIGIAEKLILQHSPKFIYIMPNYHNPTGIRMSLQKRLDLLNLSNKYCVPIIEEDSQRDFRYCENRIPSLYVLDQYNSVLYIDSFTLTFPYGTKTGYVVGPYDLIEMLGKVILVDETVQSNFGQYMLNEYIETGCYFEHIEKLSFQYKQKLNIVCDELNRIKNKGIEYLKPEGGLLIWCTLDPSINEKKLYEKAKSKGVLIVPGFLFYSDGYSENGHIRLSFSSINTKDIKRAISLLGEALDEVREEII